MTLFLLRIAPLLLTITTALLQAQPKVTAVGNGADYGSTVAPGSLATVFGTGLASGVASPSALPFPTALTGVSISVNGRLAPLTYISPTQINFQVPAALGAGNYNLTVTNSGQTSAAFPISVAAVAPGVFQFGVNRGIVQNQDYSLNATASPAASGSTIIVYLTGIGVTTPAVADGTAAPASPLAVPNAKPVSATIGGAATGVQFLGLTPGNVGLAQANLVVPSLASGDYPLTITVAGQTSKTVLVSVKNSANLMGNPSSVFPPPSAKCVSGQVDYFTYSLQNRVNERTDEASIGGVKVCPTCSIKPPVYGPLATLLAEASDSGLSVDACYDESATINLIRLRRL